MSVVLLGYIYDVEIPKPNLMIMFHSGKSPVSVLQVVRIKDDIFVFLRHEYSFLCLTNLGKFTKKRCRYNFSEK